jgi:thiamine-phosphate pyrophosphorylase
MPVDYNRFMERAAYRIIDANFNRAREAARLMEEFCRFALNSTRLSSQAKELRHTLCAAAGSLDTARLIAARDTAGDVGTSIKVQGQLTRSELRDCLTAACSRLTESLRALAEVLRTVNPALADTIEKLRYSAYTLEKEIITCSEVRGKFKSVRLYVVITADLPVDVIRLADNCVAGGADCIQLRAKAMNDESVFALAVELVKKCRDAGVLCIINDRVDIAVAAGADGVHLGQTDLPLSQARKLESVPLILGKSTHSPNELHTAINQGADYVSLGPVFATDTKPEVRAVGLDYLKQGLVTADAAGIGHAAIGGINSENINDVLRIGVKTIAVCSAVCGSREPRQMCRLLKQLITNARK